MPNIFTSKKGQTSGILNLYIFNMACLIIVAFLIGFIGIGEGFLTETSPTEQLQQEVAMLKTEIANMQQSFLQLQSQLNATSDLAAKAAAIPHTNPVAFTADLTTTIQNIAQHTHVAFDKVITNLGGAYDKTTGHFTAPVFGLYSFTLTITNTPGHSSSLSLVQNGQQKAVGLAHGTSSTPSQWETSTVSAALVLNKGDEVWAQNEGQFSPSESVDGYNYSSFTGHLLAKL